MSAPTLGEIRDALKATLNGLGLQVYRSIVDVANFPAVIIDLAQKPSITYTGAFAMGGDEYFFDFIVFVANTDTVNAQNILDAYVTGQGAKSIRQALFNGINLDGADAMAMSVSSYGIESKVASINVIGAVVRVVVAVT